ncbi:DUF3817 domain-containing protein [Pseudonocardia sp. TRM90224]|uniref:DUF3817 domain-containing protein n=1 Tax=Pseudonocardia sp. TRM90224 TaxID=2812678 RepID=UPI001E63ABFF|nr:DUF3817 domain-containing protein [Pseudonocardia sp. TRM90224]
MNEPVTPPNGLLLAYRIAAYVTGVGLLLLVFVAMPLKYFFGQPWLVAIVGVAHGFLYMAYIVCTLVLAERCRWRPLDALVILLAGTIPIASFLAERKVTTSVRAGRSPFAKADVSLDKA